MNGPGEARAPAREIAPGYVFAEPEWTPPLDAPVRRQRLAAWLRRWEVADRFPSGGTRHVAYRFTRWGADWLAGNLNALARHRPGYRVIVRRRR